MPRPMPTRGAVRAGAYSGRRPAFSMKVLKRIGGDAPVLLLDDVMSELDRNRRMRLVSEISDYQTFITCTDETDLELGQAPRIYHVSSEDGTARIKETGSGAPMVLKEITEPDFT